MLLCLGSCLLLVVWGMVFVCFGFVQGFFSFVVAVVMSKNRNASGFKKLQTLL